MHQLAGFLLVALSATCFGVMPILANVAYSSGTGTSTLLFLRFFVGGLFMLMLVRAKNLRFPQGRHILHSIGLGALGYAGQSFCYFTALKHATPSLVALLLYIFPAIVTIISVVFLREKMTFAKFIAICLALSGCALIVGFSGTGNVKGVSLALTAAVIYSLYIIVGSRTIQSGHVVQSSAVIMLSAALVFCVSMIHDGFEPPRDLNGLLSIVAIALVSTVVAMWSFFAGLDRIGPTNSSLVSTLEPVVTVLCSVFFLGESLSAANIFGGGLILGALAVVSVSQKRRC
jgi:drug/metabolite transporter (DMT)-like permease